MLTKPLRPRLGSSVIFFCTVFSIFSPIRAMATLDRNVEPPLVHYADVRALVLGDGEPPDFHPTQRGHREATRSFRRRLLEGAQPFGAVKYLPEPQTHCQCGLGVRFAQEACLEALLHERATGEPASLADVCVALGLGYPYCCRSCAFGHLDLLEVWSWLYLPPEEAPWPLGCHPALDFVGQTLRCLPLLPPAPPTQAWLATEGPGARTQRELYVGLRRLLGVAVRSRSRELGGAQVSVQQTLQSVGRARQREGGELLVTARVRVSLVFDGEVVELPGLWPASPFPYCRKGALPSVRGRAVDVRLCAEPARNQVFVSQASDELEAFVHSWRPGGPVRRLSVRFTSDWEVRAPTDPPPPASLEQALTSRRPRARPEAWVPMGSWLHWLAGASGAPLPWLRGELMRRVRERLGPLPAAPEPKEAVPQPQACWRLDDVLPHAGPRRLEVLAELMAELIKVKLGLAPPRQAHETKAYRQRALVWENEFRKHLARTADAALQAAARGGAGELALLEDQDLEALDDPLDFFASEAEACDYADSCSLQDGRCRLVARRCGARCAICGGPWGPGCCLGRALGVGHHVFIATPSRGRTALEDAAGRRRLALATAARLKAAPRELDRVLLGQSKQLKAQVAGPVLATLRETGRGKAARRCTAPVPEQHDVHVDSLAVSDSGGSHTVHLRSCGRVLCALTPGSLAALRAEVLRLRLPEGAAEARLAGEVVRFSEAALGEALQALRFAVVRAALASGDLEVLYDAVATHRWEGSQLVAEVLVHGGPMAMAVRARAEAPPPGLSYQDLFVQGYLVHVVPNEFLCLREPGAPFAADGLTFGLLDGDLMCSPKLLQTPHGFGHCIRVDYVRKGVAHGLTAAPLRWDAPSASSFQALGNAVCRPNPRGLPPLDGGAMPMTVIAGWKRDYGGQLQEDSFGVNRDWFRNEWRRRVVELRTRWRPAAETQEPGEGLDARGFSTPPGRFVAAQEDLYRWRRTGERLLAPRDCWVLHADEERRGGKLRGVFRVLLRVRAGAGDKFLMAFQKFCAVPLERPLCTVAGTLAGMLNSPSISSRNSEKVFVEGFVSHLALALGVSYHRRAGGGEVLEEVQRLLCGEGCSARRLAELRRLQPGASLGCLTQGVELRTGRHLGPVLTLPHTLYAAKQNGEERASSCRSKVDRCWFDLMGTRGFAPAVRSAVSVCSECGALGSCSHEAPRCAVALSQRTASADSSCRAMGSGLRVTLGPDTLPEYSLVVPAAPEPEAAAASRQDLLRVASVPDAAAWRLEPAGEGRWSTGSGAGAEIVLDLLLADAARRGRAGFPCKGETHCALFREAPTAADLARLARRLESWASEAASAPLTWAGGGAALELPEERAPEALAALRWGAEVLAVRRAVLLDCPSELPLKVLNRSYARYEDCAEVTLATWLRRNLSREVLRQSLERLPLSPEAAREAPDEVELELRGDAPGKVLYSTDLFVAGTQRRLFGMAVVLGPNPWSRGWLERGQTLGGFRARLVRARPCADAATLWHMVDRGGSQDLDPLVAASPALVSVCSPAPVYRVRKFRGMPRNPHCCRYGCFSQGRERVEALVEERCDDCGDCKAEDLEDLADARRGPVIIEQKPGALRLRCATNEGLDDGSPRPAAGPEHLPPGVRRLLGHDTPEAREARARRALDLLLRAARELAATLSGAAS